MRTLPCLVLTFVVAALPAAACNLKLLLSWDVSASMSEHDYRLQRAGTAEAFRDPTVQNMVALNPGGVAVSVVQWAGADQQHVSVPWIMLRSNRDAAQFAGRIEAIQDPFTTIRGTAIGASLSFSLDHLAGGPDCSRTVIDISGDGVSNIGNAPGPVADYLETLGVTINGLVLPASGKYLHDRDPFMHYVRHVSRGSDSFVMLVGSYEDFPVAMRNKLLRELTPEIALLADD